ncbi:hypothetical protein D3C78_760570 [compost metagenome]
MVDQFAGLAGQGVLLVAEGGGEQPRGVQGLHQVVADGGEEAGLGLVGRFGRALGLDQRLVELGQLVGAFGDPLLQPFVGILQGLLGLPESGDVGEAHDEAAAGHRIADQLDDPAVGEQPLGGVRPALTHPVEAPCHMGFHFARPAEAALGVEADDVGDRPADADQAFGIVEQFQVAAVPGHQAQGLVDHADALGDVLDGALQQGAVELQHLGGFVGDAHHVFHLHLAAFDGGLHHGPRRRGAEHAGEQAFAVGDPVLVGVLFRVEVDPRAVGEADEALPRALFADEARGEHQEVVHLDRQQRARTGARRDLLADEAAGLPVFGDAGAGEDRDPGEEDPVAGERQHHALGQGFDGQVQGVVHQPGQAGEVVQRPAQAAGHHRQHQGVGPEGGAGGEAGEHATAVGLFPEQRADHRRTQLGDGGEGDLADGRQARGGTQQAITDVAQQDDHHDAHPAYREHPVAEHLEGTLGVLPAQQPGQQHVVGDHGGQRHGFDDHHAGGGRGAADEGQQRQGRVGLGQGQADDEGVRDHAAGQQHLSGQGDGHHEERGQGQVDGEDPARLAQVLGLDVFYHRDVELPGQADDGEHGHARLHQHRRPVQRLRPIVLQLGGAAGASEEVIETVEQAEGDVGAHREEGQQLDQGLEGNGQHHATVVLGGVEVAGAEEDGEQRQHQGHDQRRVLSAGAGGFRPRADQQVHPEDDALELQGDVGQHADQADQRHHHRQGLRLAVARGDEVGDGGDVLLLADQHHLLHHPGCHQEQQDGAEVDGQEVPYLPGGLADRAEEGPAGAVDRQRQAVDPGTHAR